MTVPMASAVALTAASAEDSIDEIAVYGRAQTLIGQAAAASEGVVGYDDFEDRPLARVGELVEVIPGVVATQHSGEGKANQYFLRGFNLDHGSDFSARVDGVPVNFRTHGHGQGYLDLNFVIPETIEQVAYRKWPYFADTGDFSLAGSARYRTYNDFADNFIEIAVGEDEFRRLVAAGDAALTPDDRIVGALELATDDGPWELAQDLKKANAFAKLVGDRAGWDYALGVTAYDSDWTSTDQIPQRAVEQSLISQFGAIDKNLGGRTTRYSLFGNITFGHASGAYTRIDGYGVDYDFSLRSNFTYFLEDPIAGDAFEQTDSRTLGGASVEHARHLLGDIHLTVGAQTQFDNIEEVGLYSLDTAGARNGVLRQDAVKEFSLGAYAHAEILITDRFRATPGIRIDYYEADVTAISLPANGGEADDTIVSPSLALAFRATETIELYANYGEGFHSNDARGSTIVLDPNTGDPADPVDLLVEGRGGEVGARYERGDVRLSLAAFTIELDSELVFVGDAATTEVNDPSRRYGVEGSLFWTPTSWLVLDASGGYTDAAFDIGDPADDIPNAVAAVVSAGALFNFDPLKASIRYRHFGSAPLIEDGSATSEPTSIVNLGVTYDWRALTFGVDVLNAFDVEDNDITYFYESRLAGEMAPVEDFHFHPVPPRQLRASVRVRF